MFQEKNNLNNKYLVAKKVLDCRQLPHDNSYDLTNTYDLFSRNINLKSVLKEKTVLLYFTFVLVFIERLLMNNYKK